MSEKTKGIRSPQRLFTYAMLVVVFATPVPQTGWAQKLSPGTVELTGNGSSQAEDRDRAMKVWSRYVQCLKDRRFEACFGLLSRNVLETWRKQHGVTTSAKYAEVKGTEEITYTELRTIRVKRVGLHILIVARVRGSGERGAFVSETEFVLVKENGNWRIDRMSEGGVDYLP